MDSSYLNFIAYECQDLFPKIEIGLEDAPSFQFSLDKISNDHMFSIENDSRSMLCKSQSSQNLIHSIFDTDFNTNASLITFDIPRKHVPFQIIRKERALKKEVSSMSDEISINVSIADKIASKSRRIIKREQAKQRGPVNPMSPALSRETTQKHSSESSEEPVTDEKSKKKMLQMIRNRISAQNSRDRKKAYIKKLESIQRKTATENSQLMKQVRVLKQANEALKLQCEQLKQGLVMCMSEAYKNLEQYDQSLGSNVNFNFRNDVEALMELKYDPYVTKNESNQTAMAKYSLALETLLAAFMFSNSNTPNTISEIQKLQINPTHKIEADLEEGDSPGRKNLKDFSVGTPETFNEGHIKIEMEQEVLKRNDSWQSVSSNSSTEGIRNLRNTFNEKYMSEFLNQLKIKTLDVGAFGQDVKFSKYIKQKQQEQLDTRVLQDQGLTPENSAALFCPSGFAFESGEENPFSPQRDFSVKLEDNLYADSKKNMKLQKTEWLQLFVPKSNLHFASLARNEKFKISADSGCDNKDNSLLELWCKVVKVKTLQAGF